MDLSLRSTVTLNAGVPMPRLGLGVWQTRPGAEARSAVAAALELGYRHIDTAALYGNEADVGRAVRESGIPREDVFITTKLWNADQGYDSALRAFERSRRALGFDSVDLYLIHAPDRTRSADSWRAMQRIAADGQARAIGVSNFGIRDLETLLGESAGAPAVNQVEFHPFLYKRELLDYCHARGIRLEAYSPLARGQRFTNRALVAIARRHGKTPAQVMIRWALHHDTVVIPKSVRRERIAENADVFDFALTPADMAALDGLDEGLRTGWGRD